MPARRPARQKEQLPPPGQRPAPVDEVDIQARAEAVQDNVEAKASREQRQLDRSQEEQAR